MLLGGEGSHCLVFVGEKDISFIQKLLWVLLVTGDEGTERNRTDPIDMYPVVPCCLEGFRLFELLQTGDVFWRRHFIGNLMNSQLAISAHGNRVVYLRAKPCAFLDAFFHDTKQSSILLSIVRIVGWWSVQVANC